VVTKRRHSFLVSLVLASIVGALLGFGIVVAYAPADAAHATPTPKDRAYGWCWLAQPDSARADECEARGWTIRRHLVLNPKRLAVTDLPECRTEDSGRCWWAPDHCADWSCDWFVNVGTTDNPYRFRWLSGVWGAS